MADVFDAQKEITQIMNQLKVDVSTILETDIAHILKEAVSQSVYENVYEKYTPTMYVRRESNGGLADTNNYIVNIGMFDLSISEFTSEITLENITTGNLNYTPVDNDITDIIEEGGPYNYENRHNRIGPRPFMDEALEKTNIEDVLYELLRKYGY